MRSFHLSRGGCRLDRRGVTALWALILLGNLLTAREAIAQTAPEPGSPRVGSRDASGKSRTLTIVVPEEGEYFVRLPGHLSKRFTDRETTITIDTSMLGKSPRIAIDDARTGNTAVMPLPTGDRLELRKLDFNRVHSLRIQVTYDNRPVQQAQVTLTASDGTTQKQTIDYTRQGIAVFEDVPAGKAQLTIRYGDDFTMTQDVQISSDDHPAGVVTIPVAVSNKVPTLDVPAEKPEASVPISSSGVGRGEEAAPGRQAAPSAGEGGGLPSLLGSLIGLALAGGAIYLLYRWAQSGGMAATLKKAGIEVSGPPPPSDAGTPWQPNAPAPPVVADPSLCPYCGQKRDAAGNCACTLAPGQQAAPSGANGAVASAPVTLSQPRLVATMGVYSGTIFPLNANGSGMTVGRDPSNSIMLGNDTTVSRRHASLRVEDGTCIVTDEGSSNGVYVNGVRISGSQTIRPGDEVQIGNTRFRFEV